MRFPLTAALATALAGATLASIAPSPATATTSKAPDLSTIGAVAHPDPGPADPAAPRLTRVTAPATTAVVAAPRPKQQAFETAQPLDAASLDASQRLKRSAVRETASPAAVRLLPNGKTAELSTILLPAPGAHVATPAELRASKRRTTVTAADAARPATRRLTSALGMIPRPEWSQAAAPAKPKDVSTIGAASGARETSAPSAAELQRRAAATVKAQPGPKSAEVTTSTPRDAAAPPASSTKAAPSHEEVR